MRLLTRKFLIRFFIGYAVLLFLIWLIPSLEEQCKDGDQHACQTIVAEEAKAEEKIQQEKMARSLAEKQAKKEG